MGIKEYLIKKLVRTKKEQIYIPCLEGHFLDDRKALVTGGSSGIGYAIAKSFLANGADVVLCGRNEEKLENSKKKLCTELKSDNSRIDILVLDISKVEDMKKKLLAYLSKDNIRIDIFVNNAGINGGDLFPNTREEDYDRILETNLKGMYFISQEIANYMIHNEISGNILNITSSSALRPAISPYIISKWGERGLTLGMAKKYLPYGIVVNGLAPGPTLTPMSKKDAENDLNLAYSPAGRYAAPEEIGNLATVLVSSMGRMIVGDTIYATGGAGVITFDDMSY